MADLKANLLFMVHSTVRQSSYLLASGKCRLREIRSLQPGRAQYAKGEPQMQLFLFQTRERCQLFHRWMLESFGLPNGQV